MPQPSDYARSVLPYGTEAELAQFAGILTGKLPPGFDASRPEDWLAAVTALRKASEARGSLPEDSPADLAPRNPSLAIPGLPVADRSDELRMVRSWMATGSRVGGSVFFGTSLEAN